MGRLKHVREAERQEREKAEAMQAEVDQPDSGSGSDSSSGSGSDSGSGLESGSGSESEEVEVLPEVEADALAKAKGKAKVGSSSRASREPATPTRRSGRVTRVIDRYGLTIAPPESPEPEKTLEIKKGSGTKLRNIPSVVSHLQEESMITISAFHKLLFGRLDKEENLMVNIGKFSGFVWGRNMTKRTVEKKLSGHYKYMLVNFCNLLGIPVAKTTKEELEAELLDFLESPRVITYAGASASEQTGRGRRGKSKAGETSGAESDSRGRGSSGRPSSSSSRSKGKKRKVEADEASDSKQTRKKPRTSASGAKGSASRASKPKASRARSKKKGVRCGKNWNPNWHNPTHSWQRRKGVLGRRDMELIKYDKYFVGGYDV